MERRGKRVLMFIKTSRLNNNDYSLNEEWFKSLELELGKWFWSIYFFVPYKAWNRMEWVEPVYVFFLIAGYSFWLHSFLEKLDENRLLNSLSVDIAFKNRRKQGKMISKEFQRFIHVESFHHIFLIWLTM